MIIILAFVYFIPTMGALTRGKYRHGRPGRVFLINLLTGWTVVGWFAAMLYWACGEKLVDRQARLQLEATRDVRAAILAR